jgi:hypothetical protein
MKTFTMSRPPIQVAHDPIIELRPLGGALKGIPLTAARGTFSLGRGATCDARLDVPAVSSVHCYLERRPVNLRVTNNSKNGTYYRGALTPSFELAPGEFLTIGGITLLAMTEPMIGAEAELRRLLGADDLAALDNALHLATTPGAVAIVGEPGSGHREVAATLHNASRRRLRGLTVLATTAQVAREFAGERDPWAVGGLYLHTDGFAKFKAREPAHAEGLRRIGDLGALGLYVGTDKPETPFTRLGLGISLERTISIPPLRQRPRDVLPLFERMLGEAGEAAAAHLNAKNRAALTKYRWPENLDELARVVELVRVILTHRGIRPAARATDEDHTKLIRYLQKVGLEFDFPADAA